MFLSPLWLHAGFEVPDVFSFTAGAGLSVAAAAHTTTERPFDYAVCLGATSSVAINAFGSYEYTHNGRIWGPHLLAGNGELCPLGETEQAPGDVAVGLASDAPDGAAIGSPVTYTATLDPGDATGTVTFADGAVVLADCEEVPVVDGTATCAQTYDAAGTHSILAAYSGDDAYGPAYTGEPLVQEVAAAALPVVSDLPTGGTYGGGFTATVADGGDAPVSVTSSTPDVCTVGGLTSAARCSTPARATSPVGVYPSTCSGVSARDYLPVYLPGQVRVQAGAPTVTLVQPADGAVYRRGQAVVAQFSCAAGAGATVTSCTGTVVSGTRLPTGTRGVRTFTVTAVGSDGQRTVVQRTYTVV